MIDEAQLKSMEERLRLHPDGIHAVFTDIKRGSEGVYCFHAEVLQEMIDLTRLGIWSRDHGIPALKQYEHISGANVKNNTTQFSAAAEALAKLRSWSGGK